MDRRELLKMIAVVTGGAVIGGEALLTGCAQPAGDKNDMQFSPDDITFLDEVAETIFPKTATPGGKEAGLGKFMTVMVNDCYTSNDQQVFHEGIKKLDAASEKMHGTSFMKASAEQRTALLKQIDEERRAYYKSRKSGDPEHYFQQMKQLTIFGYFTSEAGRKNALRYVPVPGRFDAVIDYKKGDKLFAGLS